MDNSKTQARTFVTKLSKEEITSYPLGRYKGPVTLVRTDEDLRRTVDALMQEEVVGFDTETRPAFRKGQVFDPSLLQLAAAKEVFLIQLKPISKFEPLRELFENESIVKSGVALDRDLRELQGLFPFRPRGFVELSEYADEIGVQSNGLRALSAILLGFRISKGARLSDWSRYKLSEDQIRYAATDAWVGREMYLVIREELEARGA